MIQPSEPSWHSQGHKRHSPWQIIRMPAPRGFGLLERRGGLYRLHDSGFGRRLYGADAAQLPRSSAVDFMYREMRAKLLG